MILVDTSLWVDHFRVVNDKLTKLLREGNILIHPMIVAELSMGSLRNRQKTLRDLDLLPQVCSAHLSEVRMLTEHHTLYGRGIGIVDASLLASVLIDPPTRLWTADKRLREIARELAIHADFLDEGETVH